MTITYESGKSGNARTSGNATSLSYTPGSTISEGELVIAYVNLNGTGSITADDSWDTTDTGVPSGETASTGVYYKIATGSEPSSYGWTFGSTSGQVCVSVFSSTTELEVSNALTAIHKESTARNDIWCGAADGVVIPDDCVSVIMGGLDRRDGNGAWTSLTQSYTGIMGVTYDQATGMAHRIYTTDGHTFSGVVRFDGADTAGTNETYSQHVSFVESAAGGSTLKSLPLLGVGT